MSLVSLPALLAHLLLLFLLLSEQLPPPHEGEGESVEVVGRKHGLEDADLGLFYAGARHLYAPDKCLFGVDKTGTRTGSSKFV